MRRRGAGAEPHAADLRRTLRRGAAPGRQRAAARAARQPGSGRGAAPPRARHARGGARGARARSGWWRSSCSELSRRTPSAHGWSRACSRCRTTATRARRASGSRAASRSRRRDLRARPRAAHSRRDPRPHAAASPESQEPHGDPRARRRAVGARAARDRAGARRLGAQHRGARDQPRGRIHRRDLVRRSAQGLQAAHAHRRVDAASAISPRSPSSSRSARAACGRASASSCARIGADERRERGRQEGARSTR